MNTENHPPRKYPLWERILLSFMPCQFPFSGIALAQLICILTGQYHPVRSDGWSPEHMPFYYANSIGYLCISTFFAMMIFVAMRQDRGDELDQKVRRLYIRNWIAQLVFWLLFGMLAGLWRFVADL